MSGFQGSILSVKLDYLDNWNDARIRNADIYNNLLTDLKYVETPTISNATKHVFHQYTIKVKNRDLLKKYLFENNIESAIYYPMPCHLQKPYKNVIVNAPISEQLSSEVLSLPISEHINRDNIEYICNTIRNFYS